MFARTDRLLLRPWWPEDASLVQALAGDATMPTVQADIDHDPLLPDLAVTRRNGGTPQLIGGIALARGDAGIELRYWIARPLWGLGYATEAAGHVARVADTLGHRRIVARHQRGNPAARRVLGKIGFRFPDDALAVREAGASADPECAMSASDRRELVAA